MTLRNVASDDYHDTRPPPIRPANPARLASYIAASAFAINVSASRP